jgi:hypothetical protein
MEDLMWIAILAGLGLLGFGLIGLLGHADEGAGA